MIRSISVTGSTGSIGTQTLAVASHLGIEVKAISANNNAEKIFDQVRKFRPKLVSLNDHNAVKRLLEMMGSDFPGTEVISGQQGNIEVASYPDVDMTVAAMVGVAGLESVLAGIKAGHDIALANKETLVAGGAFVMEAAEKAGVKIFPVDSEHSAIWQCLPDNEEPGKIIRRLFLTASGGPFRGWNKERLVNVNVEEALSHPTWIMGNKITIDSATLMNKGLEVIEAHWLFNVDPANIRVVIHPQSIIHSMVEFVDGSVLGQLGFADMKIPIQAALTRKERVEGVFREFDPVNASPIVFEEPDMRTFRCLPLAFDALKTGGSMPAVMNSANEKAVELFLGRRISFLDIPELIEETMDLHSRIGVVKEIDYETISELDKWARSVTGKAV
ncbi:MAG: 1-deoxy-D-xylulose-5-phosphate reductoisomerase [Saccharofermentanales bacterium]